MISNIVIVGIDRRLSRQVAEIISEQLGMHFVDTIELFEFDHIPRSLADILESQGEGYFRKKEKGLSGYVSEFENTVIHAESGCVNENDNIETLKQNAVVVYIKKYATSTKRILGEISYENSYLKRFFNISLEKIKARQNLWIESANIVVDAKNYSALKVSADSIRAIENYFLK